MAGYLQAGVLADGVPKQLNIPQGLRLDVAIVTSGGVSKATFTATTRAGQSLNWTVIQNERLSLDGRLFSGLNAEIQDGLPGTVLLWALVPGDSPVHAWGGSTNSVINFGNTSQPVNVTNFPSGFDVNNFPSKIIFAGIGPAPITGTWRGYAVAKAAGEVSIEISGVTVALGTATAAGQSFAFTLGIGATVTPALTNCSIGGGILEP